MQKEPRVHPLLLVLIAISLAAVAQIFFKTGMNDLKLDGAPGQQTLLILRAVFKPAVFFGLFLYVVSTVLWLKLLSTQELSYIYPMIAVSYVMVTVLSIVVLKEDVPPLRWLALLVICLGVAMLAILGKNSQTQASATPKAISQAVNANSQNLYDSKP
jgi:drug/metabolite transporter (DMT)-like permease